MHDDPDPALKFGYPLEGGMRRFVACRIRGVKPRFKVDVFR